MLFFRAFLFLSLLFFVFCFGGGGEEFIELEFNSFGSTIPSEIALLPNLRFFYIRNSLMEGNIDFLPDITNIGKLSFCCCLLYCFVKGKIGIIFSAYLFHETFFLFLSSCLRLNYFYFVCMWLGNSSILG